MAVSESDVEHGAEHQEAVEGEVSGSIASADEAAVIGSKTRALDDDGNDDGNNDGATDGDADGANLGLTPCPARH